jgi:hypothetical protein
MTELDPFYAPKRPPNHPENIYWHGVLHLGMDGANSGVMSPGDLESDAEIMGAYDSIGGVATFVVADITADGSWLAMSADSVIDVESHR